MWVGWERGAASREVGSEWVGGVCWGGGGLACTSSFYFILFYFCLFLHFACNSLVSVQFCSYFVCLFVYIKYLGSVYIINLMCFCINLM